MYRAIIVLYHGKNGNEDFFFLTKDEVHFFQKSLKVCLYSNSLGNNLVLKSFILHGFI